MTNWSCQGRKAQHQQGSNEVILKKRNWDKVSSMSSGKSNNEERREVTSSRETAEAFGMHWAATPGCPLTQSGQKGQSYYPGGTESGDRYGLVNGWKSVWQDRAEAVLENWLCPFPGHISLEVNCLHVLQLPTQWQNGVVTAETVWPAIWPFME